MNVHSDFIRSPDQAEQLEQQGALKMIFEFQKAKLDCFLARKLGGYTIVSSEGDLLLMSVLPHNNAFNADEELNQAKIAIMQLRDWSADQVAGARLESMTNEVAALGVKYCEAKLQEVGPLLNNDLN